MGKLTWFGWSPPHDPMYGIDHANIAPELTTKNWKTRAVVRSGMYIWVLRGTHTGENSKKVARYYVRVYANRPTLDLQRDFLTYPAKIADLKRSRKSLKVLKKDPDEINYISRNLIFPKK